MKKKPSKKKPKDIRVKIPLSFDEAISFLAKAPVAQKKKKRAKTN